MTKPLPARPGACLNKTGTSRISNRPRYSARVEPVDFCDVADGAADYSGIFGGLSHHGDRRATVLCDAINVAGQRREVPMFSAAISFLRRRCTTASERGNAGNSRHVPDTPAIPGFTTHP